MRRGAARGSPALCGGREVLPGLLPAALRRQQRPEPQSRRGAHFGSPPAAGLSYRAFSRAALTPQDNGTPLETDGLLLNSYTYGPYEVLTDRQRILGGKQKRIHAWLRFCLAPRLPRTQRDGQAGGGCQDPPRAGSWAVSHPPASLPLAGAQGSRRRHQPSSRAAPTAGRPPLRHPVLIPAPAHRRERLPPALPGELRRGGEWGERLCPCGLGSCVAGKGSLARLSVWSAGAECSATGPGAELWQHPSPRSAASPVAAAWLSHVPQTEQSL